MAPVKVFGPAQSTNVARVLLCLEEVGAEYEVVNVDFTVMEHKSPEHLKRNVRVHTRCLCSSALYQMIFSAPES